jgi:hypothetical protein
MPVESMIPRGIKDSEYPQKVALIILGCQRARGRPSARELTTATRRQAASRRRAPAIFLGGKHAPLAGFSEIHQPDTVFATYPIVPFTPTR